jgi:pyrimidine-nucleoside phosphorylase
MVEVGQACGRKVCALITNMDVTLGTHIGNALEVKEAVRILRGEQEDDLYRVCIALAANMLSLCMGWSVEEAEEKCIEAIRDGRAYRKLLEWISAQGGDTSVLEELSLLPVSSICYELCAPEAGYISHMATDGIGTAACLLGAGRAKKEDTIDPAAGIVLQAKTGDYVEKGQCIAYLYTSSEALLPAAERAFLESLTFTSLPPVGKPLIFTL